MDLNQKAINRQQIEELTLMQIELKSELRQVTTSLAKVDNAISSNKKFSAYDKKCLKQYKEIYENNKAEIESTLKTMNDLIAQKRAEDKPRAYLQMTNKLV